MADEFVSAVLKRWEMPELCATFEDPHQLTVEQDFELFQKPTANKLYNRVGYLTMDILCYTGDHPKLAELFAFREDVGCTD